MRFRLFLLVALCGCVELSHQHSVSLPADGIESAFVDIERGDLQWVGEVGSDTLALEVWTQAGGATAGRAGRNEASIDWGVWKDEQTVSAWSYTPALSSRADWWVVGPDSMALDILSPEGTISVQGVRGNHLLTASGINLDRVSGDIDAYSSRLGLTAALEPEVGDVITLHAVDGDVWLMLPEGVEMDLEVFADPVWGMEIVNLGFDRYTSLPGYFAAETGEARTSITVYVDNGGFVLLPSDVM